MKKLVNIVFVAIVSCVLLGTLGYIAVREMLPDLKASSYSQLEARSYQQFPDITRDALESGTFQKEFSTFISDSIPLRNTIILENAAVQRALISMANVPFGYEFYPSYFGSVYVVEPAYNAVYPVTRKISPENATVAEKLTQVINEAAQEHPNITFVYDMMDEPYTTEANPSYDYVENAYTRQWYDEQILDKLDPRIIKLTTLIESPDELRNDWFATEHHWKIGRALATYNTIAETLGLETAQAGPETTVYDSWMGACSRYGKVTEYRDSLEDVMTDFSALEVYEAGEPTERGLREPAGGIDWSKEPEDEPIFYNAYHAYFGHIKSDIEYVNTGANNGKTCLFIEQSYGVIEEPYIALNYAKTYCFDPFNTEVNMSLEEMIEKFKPDDVIIQFGSNDLWKIRVNSPKFIGE